MAGAAFFDLDRTLLRGASGPIISEALRAEGLLGPNPVPGEKLMFGLFNAVGETLPAIALTRQAARAAKGWSIEAAHRAGERAAQPLVDAVEPFAREMINDHQEAGRPVVLATTTPIDMVRPFAELLGLDGVLATHYRVANGVYDGTIDGEFVWNRGKSRTVKEWARANLVELADSFAYSDSIFDLPMLHSVGHPVAVNPDPRLMAYALVRGWQTLWFNAPAGVPKPLGIEPQQVATALARPELLPWVRIEIDGLENAPDKGGVIFAANHRSYLDPTIVGFAGGKLGRPVRFLAKKEVTDAPIVGQFTKALGAIRVDRENAGTAPMEEAARALRAGEVVAVFPQGTIPRGEAFFDPMLQGRYGVVRLALETGVPIVPIGLWGTEKAWPRNRKLPYLLNLADPAQIQVTVGKPYHPTSEDIDEAIVELMEKISALLPPESRVQIEPTPAQLAATYPPGHEAG